MASRGTATSLAVFRSRQSEGELVESRRRVRCGLAMKRQAFERLADRRCSSFHCQFAIARRIVSTGIARQVYYNWSIRLKCVFGACPLTAAA